MMARLGQNLGIKLLSLIFSVSLYLYVRKQQPSELTVQVPLTLLIDPATRVVDETVLRQMISVTLSGPAERLKAIESRTKASADLRGQGSGSYRATVEVEIPPESRGQVDRNWQPRVINVQLEKREMRRLPVQAVFNVQPPAGLTLAATRVQPQMATITGWESDVRRVRHLQAVINTFGLAPHFEQEVPVRAVDSQGVEVSENIQVQPPTIRVEAHLERAIWSKPVYVSPTLGDVPPTVRLHRISISPRRLVLRGPESLVGPVEFLETETIPLPDKPGVVDREVKVTLPAGVKTQEPPRVRVVITLQGAVP
jgi:YbbR domain-containing protein